MAEATGTERLQCACQNRYHMNYEFPNQMGSGWQSNLGGFMDPNIFCRDVFTLFPLQVMPGQIHAPFLFFCAGDELTHSNDSLSAWREIQSKAFEAGFLLELWEFITSHTHPSRFLLSHPVSSRLIISHHILYLVFSLHFPE